MNDIYLKFAMKPMMIERRSFEWLAAHMASNKALKFTKPSLANGGNNNIAIIQVWFSVSSHSRYCSPLIKIF